jgi:adenylate cyclase
MRKIIKTLSLYTLLIAGTAHADPIVQQFKDPSFNGVNWSNHVLSIQSIESSNSASNANAPVNNEQHALDAVRTSFQMLKALKEFNDEITKEGVPAFGMGLGINTDTVVVGNMGSDQRFDYTCLGDGVNLASRLEGQSKPYGVRIVIGPKTAEYVKDRYQVVELDLIAVKGKTEPARIYTVLEKFDEKAEIVHEKFLSAYISGAWNRAHGMARAMRGIWQGQLTAYYDMMADRIEEIQKNPPKPKDWDGIYRATSK